MSPRHFSRYGGPYFINNGVSRQERVKTSSRLFTIPRNLFARITKGRKKSQGIPEEFFKDQQFFEE